LNTKAGWSALTGTTSFADIGPSSLAFNIFLDRILSFVGSYHLKLQGVVDALVFSGGIGERSAPLRREVGRAVRCLGFEGVDGERNEGVGREGEGEVVDIGGGGDGISVLVCKTDEQMEMARECVTSESLMRDG
jgi:acetate kinase